MKEMELGSVKELPKRKGGVGRKSVYEPIVREFLESENDISEIIFTLNEWDKNEPYKMRSALNQCIKRNGITECYASVRERRVFLIRTEVKA